MEGNQMKMREALEKIRRELNSYCNDCTLPDRMTEDPPDYTCLRDSLLEIERIVDAALSAPPRNCDVGTAEEQANRFLEYCKVAKPEVAKCDGCPIDNSTPLCEFAFAQMPYESEARK